MTVLELRYEDHSGTRYRLRVVPRDRGPGCWLVREERDGPGWRTVGREAISSVDVTEDTEVLL